MPPPDDRSIMAETWLPPERRILIERFEKAWRQEIRPNLDDFLPDGSEERVLVLHYLVAIELRHRLKLGEPARLEPYLLRYPELASKPTVVAALARYELAIRKRLEPGLRFEEYIKRFPALEVELRRHWMGLAAQGDASTGFAERFTEPNSQPPQLAALDPLSATADYIPRGTLGESAKLQRPPQATRQARASRTIAPPGFEILGELGRGGMGVVFKALEVDLKRPVALKMILAGTYASLDTLARFRTEAEAVAKLRHPNIVQIYRWAEHEGLPYFTLEFLEGGSLDRRIKGGALPPEEAARLVETVARAIAAAHEQGIIHRDLKPANILLTADGTPKISDFGLVKLLEDAGRTSTGEILGTPNYMAPEQALGNSLLVGCAADIYALGAVLYELLTGQPPFRAESLLETLDLVRFQPPVPLRQLRSQIPAALESISLKCLAKRVEDRYGSALELADDLHRFLEGLPVRAWRSHQESRTAPGVPINVLASAVRTSRPSREAPQTNALEAKRKTKRARRGKTSDPRIGKWSIVAAAVLGGALTVIILALLMDRFPRLLGAMVIFLVVWVVLKQRE